MCGRCPQRLTKARARFEGESFAEALTAAKRFAEALVVPDEGGQKSIFAPDTSSSESLPR